MLSESFLCFWYFPVHPHLLHLWQVVKHSFFWRCFNINLFSEPFVVLTLSYHLNELLFTVCSSTAASTCYASGLHFPSSALEEQRGTCSLLHFAVHLPTSVIGQIIGGPSTLSHVAFCYCILLIFLCVLSVCVVASWWRQVWSYRCVSPLPLCQDEHIVFMELIVRPVKRVQHLYHSVKQHRPSLPFCLSLTCEVCLFNRQYCSHTQPLIHKHKLSVVTNCVYSQPCRCSVATNVILFVCFLHCHLSFSHSLIWAKS